MKNIRIRFGKGQMNYGIHICRTPGRSEYKEEISVAAKNGYDRKFLECLKDYLADLDVIFTAKPEAPYSCSAVTLGNKLKITFLRTIREPLLEQQFDKIVSKEDIFY